MLVDVMDVGGGEWLAVVVVSRQGFIRFERTPLRRVYFEALTH